METVKDTEHWYEVRLGRILFFADPSEPGISRRGNVWANPGQYVEASHPILQAIVRTQRHKLRRLKLGDTIPAGSLIQDGSANPYIKRLMDKYDGKQEDGGTKTAEEIVVGEGGKGAPTLTPAPATTEAPAAPVPPEATVSPPAAPAAPPAPPDAEAASVPPAAPAAPLAPWGTPGGEPPPTAEGAAGGAEDLGII